MLPIRPARPYSHSRGQGHQVGHGQAGSALSASSRILAALRADYSTSNDMRHAPETTSTQDRHDNRHRYSAGSGMRVFGPESGRLRPVGTSRSVSWGSIPRMSECDPEPEPGPEPLQ